MCMQAFPLLTSSHFQQVKVGVNGEGSDGLNIMYYVSNYTYESVCGNGENIRR